MKKQINNLVIALAFILTIGCLVGCVKQEREKSRQAQTVTSSTTKEDKEAIKQKQLTYLKEHEKEIVDFVKAQSPKIESVQIDWDQTQWGDGGLTTPEYYMSVYGRINHIEESGWGVDIPINDDNTLNLDEMYIGSDIDIEGRLLE
ncbi:hypothetical protein [uncultured Streptococcus sp.]|uniref:hypothetical protein n=1 Tax=uncultured Streptococcus sp. TaxID=83427 RepID=UPI00259BA370|nr:hypothetical protein [uncultured Streptococcus sp.]